MLVSSHHTGEMAWCASEQLGWFGECRFRFFYGVMPRCARCPLLDLERAVRDVLGENTPAVIEIHLPQRLAAELAADSAPPITAPQLDPDWPIPDSPPAEWGQQNGAEPG